MRSFPILVIIILLFTGCGNKKTANMPPAPVNTGTVAAAIKGKKFKTTEMALIPTLLSDKNNHYEWFDEIKYTTAFFRKYEKQKMKFSVQFIDDTSAEVADEALVNKATWKIDNDPKSGETAGIFLRLSMER